MRTIVCCGVFSCVSVCRSVFRCVAVYSPRGVQGGEDPWDPLYCRSFSTQKPLNIGYFREKWPIKIRDPMSLRHPVHCTASTIYTRFTYDRYRTTVQILLPPHPRTKTHMRISAYVYTHMCTHMHVHIYWTSTIYVNMYSERVDIYLYICICIHLYTHVYIHIYIYVYLHTYL